MDSNSLAKAKQVAESGAGPAIVEILSAERDLVLKSFRTVSVDNFKAAQGQLILLDKLISLFSRSRQ